MKPDETRPLPENFLKALREHKKELIKMEKENNALIDEIEDIISDYKEKEDGTPMNVDCLSVILHNRKYEIETLKRNTKRAIEDAKGGIIMKYTVIKLKAMQSGKRMAFIHEGKVWSYGRLIERYLRAAGFYPHHIRKDWIDITGIEEYKTLKEAKKSIEEYEKGR